MRSALLKLSRAVFGWPPHPPTEEAKRAHITQVGKQYQVDVLIETGTFRGDMIAAQRGHFRRLITIELADAFWEAACQRFFDAPEVTVLHGDSGVKLGEAIAMVEGPVLYWLDGHYSGGETASGSSETPIVKELDLIVARGNSRDVILIDDARLFGWRRGYPRLSVLRRFLAERWPGYELKVEKDIIHIVPADRK